jgi:hypothetical protein
MREFRSLPGDVQRQARAAYRLFRDNPYHGSLQFKRVHSRRPIYSVRIGIGYRALGILEEGQVTWFWIGPHADYDQLVTRLRRL